MSMNYYLLFLTIVTEYLITLLFFRKEPLKLLFFIILINCFTWPLANQFYVYLINNYFTVSPNFYHTKFSPQPFIITELMVFAFEWVFIKLLLQITSKKALLLSLIANSTTIILSFIIPLMK